VLDVHGQDGGGVRSGMPSQLPQLRVRVQQATTAAVVILPGEVDLATLGQLRDCLDALDGNVVLDLFAVSFLDSSGLGVLAATRKRLRAQGGDLRLRSPQDHVRRVVEITGLGGMVIGGPPSADRTGSRSDQGESLDQQHDAEDDEHHAGKDRDDPLRKTPTEQSPHEDGQRVSHDHADGRAEPDSEGAMG
jgi:anti-sigma B factor antagonist